MSEENNVIKEELIEEDYGSLPLDDGLISARNVLLRHDEEIKELKASLEGLREGGHKF